MKLNDLIGKGFFPKELPPFFTTQFFSDFVISNPNLLVTPNQGKQFISKPCLHNLAKPGNQRRLLSLLNPFSYYLIAKTIIDSWSDLENHFNKSSISLSIPISDELGIRAIKKRNDKDLVKKRIELRSSSQYILRTDISRFYHSIYTHSIPWALQGKSLSKSNRTGGFSNDLDKYFRNCQDGQTMGIPVGPDTSHIISEIVGCAIDVELQNKNIKGFRIVDDFEFGFINKSEAENALPIIEEILREFELALNPSKTFINELPLFLDSSWVFQLREFNFGYPIIKNNKIIEFFNLAYELHNTNKKEAVLTYAIKIIPETNFEDMSLIEDLILQCIIVEPGTIQEALYFFESKNIMISKDKLEKVIFLLIDAHGQKQHGSEVAWAIWAAIWYKIDIPDELAYKIMKFDDSVIALLACYAKEKGIIKADIFDYWKSLMTTENLTEKFWLLLYEAEIRDWLPTYGIFNHIDDDPNFSLLKSKGISFLNPLVNEFVTEVPDIYNREVDEKSEKNEDDEFDWLSEF